jgi:hypothetical protein
MVRQVPAGALVGCRVIVLHPSAAGVVSLITAGRNVAFTVSSAQYGPALLIDGMAALYRANDTVWFIFVLKPTRRRSGDARAKVAIDIIQGRAVGVLHVQLDASFIIFQVVWFVISPVLVQLGVWIVSDVTVILHWQTQGIERSQGRVGHKGLAHVSKHVKCFHCIVHVVFGFFAAFPRFVLAKLYRQMNPRDSLLVGKFFQVDQLFLVESRGKLMVRAKFRTIIYCIVEVHTAVVQAVTASNKKGSNVDIKIFERAHIPERRANICQAFWLMRAVEKAAHLLSCIVRKVRRNNILRTINDGCHGRSRACVANKCASNSS